MVVAPGIYWDVREPLPPWLQETRENLENHARRPHRRPAFARQPVPPAFGYQQPDPVDEPIRNHLPPLSVSLAVKVVHDAATTTATQLFHNSSNAAIQEAVYSFPLPAGCSVTAFSCRVGRNQVIKAKIKPKEDAREAFQSAMSANRTAGLIEQSTPEVFTVQLGNIPAQTKLKADITFISLLKYTSSDQCSTAILTIPTCIAPRYGPLPSGFQPTPPNFSCCGIGIDVEIMTMDSIQTIRSTTHDIDWQLGVSSVPVENLDELAQADMANDLVSANVSLRGGPSHLERDFVLEIVTEPPDRVDRPQALLQIHPDDQSCKALMLTFPPRFLLNHQISLNGDREIVFIADRSGSMSDKISSLKSAMKIFLKSIPVGTMFNICSFGSDHTLLWPRAVEYSEETLQASVNHVAHTFNSNMGGTELLSALLDVCKTRYLDRLVDYIVLTDGEIWKLDEVIDFVRDTRETSEGRCRFFALGIGDAVSHELVEGIATAGGGYSEVIPAANQGGWEDRVVSMLRSALEEHGINRRLRLSWASQGQDTVMGEYSHLSTCLSANHLQI